MASVVAKIAEKIAATGAEEAVIGTARGEAMLVKLGDLDDR